jgi:hypothetical protein
MGAKKGKHYPNMTKAALLRAQSSSGQEHLRQNGVNGTLRLVAYNKSRMLPNGGAGKNILLRQYKDGAKARGLEWTLSEETFFSLLTQDCTYCGTAPAQEVKGFLYNGVDRQDNTRGYAEGNCVSCCGLCNFWKRDLSVENFKEHASKVAAFLANRSAMAAQAGGV